MDSCSEKRTIRNGQSYEKRNIISGRYRVAVKSAKTSDFKIFSELVFPKAFQAAAMSSYSESKDTYKSEFVREIYMGKFRTVVSVIIMILADIVGFFMESF